MFLIPLIVMLAATPTDKPDCSYKTVKVCKLKKKPVKVVIKKTQKVACCQNQQVIVVINNTTTETHVVQSTTPTFGLGLRGAVGLWSCDQHVFGLLGARLRLLPLHLGVEANTQFYWGHSIQAMLYPVQGPFAWHLDIGALRMYHLGFSTQDVYRKWDLLVGTGIEAQIVPHLSFTADWRMTFLNPVDMAHWAWPDSTGRYLNSGNVVGNSFLRSQIMVGLMLHSW